MDFFENRYYNVNRLTLSIVGLWPYQHLYRRLISVTLLFLVFGTGMLVMMSKMRRADITIVFVLYCLQYAVPFFLMVTSLVYCFVNANKMKILLEHIKCDWSLFQPCDSDIIERYAEIGRIFTLWTTVLGVFLASVPLFQTGKRSNLGSHSNHSDIIKLLMPIDISDIAYDDNFVYFLLVAFVILVLGILTTVAVGTLYFSSVQHACGIFCVAGTRMEIMFNDLENDFYAYKKKTIIDVFQGITFHMRAIGFLNIVNTFYGPLYITKMSILVMLLSIDMFQVTAMCGDVCDFENSFVNLGHFLCILLIMAMFCYTGQVLLDHSNDISGKIYASQWYVAPLSTQKLILIVMIRSLKVSGITLTKSITVSFEMLATTLQMSVSYFMAMSSLQG